MFVSWFQRAYFYVSLGSVWLKEVSSNFKLQVANLGFDRRFVQVCRQGNSIFNRADTLLLSLRFLRQCYLYIYVQHLYSALFAI